MVARTYHVVQFQQNKRFVDRGNMLGDLEGKLLTGHKHRTLVLAGLGGIGKTQLALEFVYRIREQHPDYSTFWVPALSMESFRQACNQIAREMDLKVSDNEDVRVAVQRRLRSSNAGKWIMIVDNADDETVLLGDDTDQAISTFLPSSDQGRVLYTTRSQQVALDLQCSEIVQIDQMTFGEGLFLLRKSAVGVTLASDDPAVGELLKKLTYLPLAISQASVFMAKNKQNPAEYLRLLQNNAKDEIYLLSQAFPDKHRYNTSGNAVANTWLVSFNQIREKHPEANELLLAMSFFEHKAIPRSLLPLMESESRMVDAMATLEAYAFISAQEGKHLSFSEQRDDLLRDEIAFSTSATPD
ncbi:hypothetical protein B9Z65_6084 [Elsinoe australis]|uniref:NB-ARC domain-containing protein n=1 Tax=Elsinoe australis TaxID=40998 RepID=A0A2P8A7M3_9PEZI|nr:hypothetical protein B9Z65_6084 [Elsinoe australis]